MPGPVPNPGVARLWSDGAPQGAGLLAAPRTVLTCGHVVSAIAGERESVPLPPGLAVELDFPLAGPTARRQAATLARHIPVAPDGTGDIAVLSLADDPPAGAEPVRLLDVQTVRDHPFTAFGFPAGDDDGVWSSGRIVDDRGRGWVQIESTGACEILQGFSGTPLWDDHLKGVVGMVVATDRRFLGRAAYAITADVLIEAHPELRRYASLPSPFRGLLPFREQDAAHYFGRSVQTVELTEAVTTSVVVPVVGASGVGKSSLVQAGLVPALRRRGDYSVATLVPEPAVRPEHMLASALLPLLGEDTAEPRGRLEQLTGLADRLRDAGAAAPAVKEALSRTGTSQLLLFIDQFEVLFRCAPGAADALVEQVLHMTGWRTADGGPLVRLVFTLRLDFLTSMRRFPALERACETSAFFVNKLSGEQLREVVLSPVDSFHGAVRFEERLAERLLSDAGRSPGALPLLEFALTLLWERQLQGVLTHAAYEEIGRVAGALATHAERAVKERLGDLTDEVRRLFVQLVRPGDADAEAPADTGRTARRTELPPACWEAAQLLAVQRLVHLDHASDGVETVSLAHEALLEHWPTLRSWVDLDRDFRTWQEHLRARIVRWEPDGRDRALLMRGSELKAAEKWLRDRPEDIAGGERDYIRASTEWRRKRRFRAALAATAVVTAMAGLAGASLSSVRDNKAAELAGGLVQEAQRQANSRLEPAALLSVAAWRTASTQQAARDNLFDRYLADARYDAVLPANGKVAETALDDAGRLIAVRTDAGRLTVWRRPAQAGQEGQAGQVVQVARMDNVSAVAVSPDGTRLAFGGDGNRIRIWDVAGRKVVQTLQAAASTASADQKVDQLAFDRTGHRLVAHPPEEDAAQLWDLDRPTAPAVRLQPPSRTEGSAWRLAFDASGEHVVSDHVGGHLAWDARSGRSLAVDEPVGGVDSPAVWFVQGARPVVARCIDSRWHLTDPVGDGTDTRVAQTVPCATGDEVAGVSDQLVLGRRKNTITVYDAHSGEPLTQFAEESASGGQYTRYYLANGSRTFTVARGTEALAVTVPEPGSLGTVSWIVGSQPADKEGDAERVQFSPSGRYTVTVGVGGPVTVWDPATGRRLSTAGAGMGGDPVHAVFDRAEKTLAVADMTEPTVTLYSLPDLRVLRRLTVDIPEGTPPESASIAGLGFGPQNRLTILAGGAVSQWDATTGRRIGRPLLFGAAATAMAVNPDSGEVAVTTPDRRGIETWDAQARHRTTVLVPGFTSQLLDWHRAVQYSADGKRVMLVGRNGETEIHDAATGRRLIAIPAAPSRYTAFLAHSEQVVSMRSDAFEVWGPAGLVTRTRIPPTAQVRAVVPSPDGEHMLLTTGTELDVRFLLAQATPDAWAAGLCSRVTRNISRSDMGTVHYGILERYLLGVTACTSHG
ncbi:trypsin-like peptidase domain-containing protein [Streptomyces sp. ET3-23]|uniref:nSTAND1 domain-containing NTPase n=1 Tax=Streptomyces sp. ET3-23 TaxID=2885643 RepID=UPI001D0F4B39|nr:trypsin-like peptidase domain-containing protein [Streptomyces sp. ET3-23]MCC2276038.1 trypsin-like peptidase domain-containing protein [Streptomyces sp. ET3-23]